MWIADDFDAPLEELRDDMVSIEVARKRQCAT